MMPILPDLTVRALASPDAPALRTLLNPLLSTALYSRPMSVEMVLAQMINLVRNAVEASRDSAGTVEIDWTEKDRWLEITIRDEGSGIADPEQLFIPFYTTKNDGMGLGLAISRSIIGTHGGRLEAIPNNNRGTVFRFTLPARNEEKSGVA